MNYAVILAGGIGSRFWPLSRSTKPKHLTNVLNDETLLKNTIDRINPYFPNENIYIVTTQEQVKGIKNTLPNLLDNQIIVEPTGKDTAGAIGLAAITLLLKDENASMVVLPSDHYISETDNFLQLLDQALNYVEKTQNELVTIGIKPRYAETGYGYVQIGEQLSDNCYKIQNFAEKPNYHTALRFATSGDFYWNSGIFIWKAKTILENIKKHIPNLYDSLLNIKAILQEGDVHYSVFERAYNEIKSLSIDYGVMEKTENSTVFIGDFYWSDVGSWHEIYRLNEKNNKNNVLKGESCNIDSENSLIYNDSKDKILCTIGIDNLFIANTDDAVIVAPLERSQDVKKMVELLKAKKLSKFL